MGLANPSFRVIFDTLCPYSALKLKMDPFLDDYVIVNEFYPISSLTFVVVIGFLIGFAVGCCIYNFVKAKMNRKLPAVSRTVELPDV